MQPRLALLTVDPASLVVAPEPCEPFPLRPCAGALDRLADLIGDGAPDVALKVSAAANGLRAIDALSCGCAARALGWFAMAALDITVSALVA